MDVQVVQENGGWWRVDCLVSYINSRIIEDPAIETGGGMLNSNAEHQQRQLSGQPYGV